MLRDVLEAVLEDLLRERIRDLERERRVLLRCDDAAVLQPPRENR